MSLDLQMEQALSLPRDHPARFVLLYGGGGRTTTLADETSLAEVDMVELEVRFLAAYAKIREVLP